LHFVEIAAEAGLPTPRWEVVTTADLNDYAALARRFGPRMVVQGPRGNAGRRTWLVAGPADLDHVRQLERSPRVRLAEHIAGVPFTVNGVARGGAPPSWAEPSRQVTGVP